MKALGRALWASLWTPGRRWCLAAVALGYVLVMHNQNQGLAMLCGSGPRAVDLLNVAFSPVWVFAASWSGMLLAMMPPLLTEPVRHVWHASLPSRRARALLFFAVGYVAPWMLVALPLTALAWWVGSALPQSAGLALVLVTALMWSVTPYAQRGRNYCHRFERVRAAGLRADQDSCRYGMRLAAACCLVCWPWMLVPLLVGTWHFAAMLAVTIWQLADRLHPPRRAVWQVPPVLDPLLVAIANLRTLD